MKFDRILKFVFGTGIILFRLYIFKNMRSILKQKDIFQAFVRILIFLNGAKYRQTFYRIRKKNIF